MSDPGAQNTVEGITSITAVQYLYTLQLVVGQIQRDEGWVEMERSGPDLSGANS